VVPVDALGFWWAVAAQSEQSGMSRRIAVESLRDLYIIHTMYKYCLHSYRVVIVVYRTVKLSIYVNSCKSHRIQYLIIGYLSSIRAL
jgi:hypothetical protein